MLSTAVAALLNSAFLRGFTPDPEITVSEWADTYRKVAKPSPEPGDWHTSRVPYMREIMDRLSPSDPSQIVALMKAAQGAGTEGGMNALGCWMHRYPDSTMVVLPTVDLAKKFSRLRFDRMVEATPVLRGLMSSSPDNGRDPSHSYLLKEFGPGRDSLVFAGANSGAALRSYPSRYILADEIDGYPTDVDNEGDPIDLILQRSGAYSNRKIFLLSTPTIEETSRISRWFKAGDQNDYLVPCPICGWMQALIWGADRAKRGEPGGVRWPAGAPDLARYQCEHCGDQFEEWRKVESIARGEWHPAAPGNGNGVVRSYKINSIYYPLGWPENAWPNLAAHWERVHRDPVGRKTFTNIKLGEPWTDPAEAKADSAHLMVRREAYGPELPHQVVVLTAGVDVHPNRFELEILGTGLDEETWSIDYRALLGDTSRPAAWQELDEFLTSEFMSEMGISLAIRATCIDAGYQQQMVRQFCEKHKFRNVWPVIGKAGQGRPVWPTKTKRQRGALIPPFSLGVDTAKEIVYARLRIATPGPGFCHFPANRERDYFEMLTAEVRVPDYSGPIPKYIWKKRSASARNESLDARVYAYAAFQGLLMQTPFRLHTEAQRLESLAATASRLPKGARPAAEKTYVMKATYSEDPYLQ